MYGYVRPDKGDLKVSEYERFRGMYCGLCHVLKERYGPACRYLVNYDFTFLAMLFAEGADAQSQPRRCPYHPLRKTVCPVSGDSLSAAADCTVILAYWKLRDGASDKGFFSALGCRIVCGVLRRNYKKATLRQPDFAAAAEENLLALAELEKAKTASLDEVADRFARLLQAAAPAAPEEAKSRILRELLYHLGRIVYILDAVDDLSEDIFNGNYNPLCYRFEISGDKLSPEDVLTLRGTLQMSYNALCGAFALLEQGEYNGILSNVIYRGLPAVTQAVFDGSWKSVSKNKTKRERSHL